MDFSGWDKLALLTMSTTSLCHLTALQLRSGGLFMVDCALIIGCWLLVCSIMHVRGTPEGSEILASKQPAEHLTVTTDSTFKIEDKGGKEDDIQSICETTIQSQGQFNVPPPTTPPSKSPDFFEPEIETTTCQLIRLNAKKEDLTTEVAQSFLVVEFQSEIKRAAMDFYFAHLLTIGSFGSDKGVGQAAYLKARRLYSEGLKMHRVKEETMRGLVVEIGELQGRLLEEKKRDIEVDRDREERRGSGETLVAGCERRQRCEKREKIRPDLD
ncbi:hypothetical protein DL98DRAFT_534669 [Cadophora sp. DSE1049]|nr:hypothetical protein DL98DRAFT_534669 [Cadophora sp. DSE1049]